MLLSIIIPVYNSREYLQRCLNSVSNLKIDNYEIIIIDDGSSDGSEEIIADYFPANESQCYKVSQKNSGASVARNHGLELASGEYVLFLDSDDYVDSDNLSSLLCLAKDFQLDFVTTPYYIFDEKSSYLKDRNLSNGDIYTGWEFVRQSVKNQSYRTELCINLYRRSVILDNKIRFYPGICYEDALFITQYLFYCNRACYSFKPFYHYRQHQGSVTAVRHSFSSKSSEVKVILLLLQFFQEKNIKDRLWNDLLISRYYRLVRFRNVKNRFLTKELISVRPLAVKGWLKMIVIVFFIIGAKEISVR